MLIHSFSVIPVELREIMDPKTPWLRNNVKVLRIGFLVSSSAPFWLKAKFSQGSRDLLPNPFIHAPIIVIPRVRHRVCGCPRK
jgi:hypothetical protein